MNKQVSNLGFSKAFINGNSRRIKELNGNFATNGHVVCFPHLTKAAGTDLAKGKETREINGRSYVLENALYGDVALVEAWRADRWGNLVYRESGRNFNPVMATAAALTIVQTQHLAELGEIDPETIVTPGIFVNRVVHIPYGDPML